MSQLSRQASEQRDAYESYEDQLLRTTSSGEPQYHLEVHFPGTSNNTPSLVFGREQLPLTGTRKYLGELPRTLDELKGIVAKQCRENIDISGVDVREYVADRILLKFRSGRSMEAAYYKQVVMDDPPPAEHVFVGHKDSAIDVKHKFVQLFERTPDTHLNDALSNPAMHNIELFFDELIDNSHQATNGLANRQVTFKFDMSKTRMKGYGSICVEDNGRGQDEDGLKGMITPGFHKSGGEASEQIGFYGIGFNSAVSSVANKIRVESRTPDSPNVLSVCYDDLSENWKSALTARQAAEQDGPSFMKIICENVSKDVFVEYYTKMKEGLHEHIANTYCLQLAPPVWADEVRQHTRSKLEPLRITIDFIAPSTRVDPDTGMDFTEFDNYTSQHTVSSLPVANTLTGLTGSDILNAPGSVQTDVFGNAGNDTITLALTNDNAYGQDGNDLITVATVSPTSSAYGGAGNDTVAFTNAVSFFAGQAGLGAGNDVISNTTVSNRGVIGGNAGNDSISIAGGGLNSRIGGGKDDDVITLSGGTFINASTQGGQGADTLAINGATFNTATISGNNGSDLINASAAVLTNTFLAGGKGTDTINLGAQIVSVAGGRGDDAIASNATATLVGGVLYGDANGSTTEGTATNANGNDLIGNTAASFTTATSIYGAGGNDTVLFLAGNNAAGQDFIVDGAEGNDLLGHSAATLRNAESTISGGAGNDTITLAAIFSGTQVLGGAGTDSITLFTAAALGGSVNGGEGADSITIGGTAILGGSVTGTVVTLNGGAGNDVIRFLATSGFITAAATGGFTQHTGLHAVVAYEAGDVIQVASTAITTSGARWFGGAGQINIVSALSMIQDAAAVYSAMSAGSVSVGTAGGDTYFFIKATTGGAAGDANWGFVVENADLVTSTSLGLVNNSTANFGFTLAADSGTAGLQVTLL
jgi:hypothetical protein